MSVGHKGKELMVVCAAGIYGGWIFGSANAQSHHKDAFFLAAKSALYIAKLSYMTQVTKKYGWI